MSSSMAWRFSSHCSRTAICSDHGNSFGASGIGVFWEKEREERRTRKSDSGSMAGHVERPHAESQLQESEAAVTQPPREKSQRLRVWLMLAVLVQVAGVMSAIAAVMMDVLGVPKDIALVGADVLAVTVDVL